VQCKNELLLEMFNVLNGVLPYNKPVVIESGGLYNVINPKFLLYIVGNDCKKVKLRHGCNRRDLSSEDALKMDLKNIVFKGGSFN